MSVSLYYTARRASPMTEAETAAADRIMDECNRTFPFEENEPLARYRRDLGADATVVLDGSTKLPADPEQTDRALVHWFAGLTRLRRELPSAEWTVHLDDYPVDWDEASGYGLPGLDGAE
ncbi:hypothetical protein AB0I28_22975 [Phytomonospora sp. NPDC050363]|uniref:hypothetical protein n=1 Tax=Phytomonospora sp. NPDC050363 TaxID=3155642 RepID=UPI0034000C16